MGVVYCLPFTGVGLTGRDAGRPFFVSGGVKRWLFGNSLTK